jgi:enterochelin esterase-like enzyme
LPYSGRILVDVQRDGAGRGSAWRRAAAALVVAVVVQSCTGSGDPTRPAIPRLDSTVVAGPQGEVEHVRLTGSSFGVHGDYTVYLPPGYGQDPARRYPVLYLLHGGSDLVSFFLELGVQKDMDDGIRSGVLGPMLLVLVDGGPMFTGEGSATRSFDDYLTSELIPDVDHRWRTVAERKGRAIGGVSVGGRHALEFAAAHPSLVAAAGGHSTTIPRSPAALAAARMPIYLDVGEGDGLYDEDAALARQLRRLDVDVRWHPAPGEHGRPYWSAHLPEYLRFYSDALGARNG